MTSLKAFIPNIAVPLGIDSVALYERQRALVGAGLLSILPGRGPGSGVRLTDKNVALLIISVMATDNLGGTVEATTEIADLKLARGECALTGAKRLVDAVALAISSQEIAEHVGDLVIHRELRRADFWDSDGQKGQRFLDERYRHPINGMVTSVRLPKRNLIKISGAYRKLSEEH